jgi:hypothetical protein
MFDDDQRLFDVEALRHHPTLNDRFVVPPFSVLDTRQGYWRERKRQWLTMGIRSELGRGENQLVPSASGDYLTPVPGTSLAHEGAIRMNVAKPPAPGIKSELGRGKNLLGFSEAVQNWGYGRGEGKPLLSSGTPRAGMGGDWDLAAGENAWGGAGTSIFDPVLCEIVYRWFSPHGGAVLDPFAGGSVRGIVASTLERIYVGVDLSAQQIAANQANAAELGTQPRPTWLTGDSRNIGALAPGSYDLVFTCPPYADLEVYSDDPADISTLGYADFVDAYRHILRETVALLAPDRFACIVVSEVREERRGCYRGLVPDTIRAMQDAGCELWNEAILVNAVGTLALRVSRNFSPNRKLGRGHQNVLVFCKGSGSAAAAACGPVRSDFDFAE